MKFPTPYNQPFFNWRDRFVFRADVLSEWKEVVFRVSPFEWNPVSWVYNATDRRDLRHAAIEDLKTKEFPAEKELIGIMAVVADVDKEILDDWDPERIALFLLIHRRWADLENFARIISQNFLTQA